MSEARQKEQRERVRERERERERRESREEKRDPLHGESEDGESGKRKRHFDRAFERSKSRE